MTRSQNTARRVSGSSPSADTVESSELSLLTHLMDSFPTEILITDHRCSIVVANKAIAKTFGISPSETAGKNALSLLFSEASHPLLNKEISHLFESRQPFEASQRLEIEGINSSGQYFPLQVVLVNLQLSDFDGFLFFVHNLTEIRELRDTIESQKIKVATSARMASLGEMVSVITHEINNPVSAMKYTAEQLGEVILDETLEKSVIQEMIDRIMVTADRVTKIVKGMRAFSRDATLDPMALVDLKNVIEDTLTFCSTRFQAHSVDLTIDPLPTDLRFFGRDVQISQVLLNLLNNALDALMEPANPAPQTSSAPSKQWVRLKVTAEDSEIHIRIIDCGPGIPTCVREKLFQPFFTTKAVGKGTGIGLTISKGIIEKHGGSLQYELYEGHTAFVIRLPKAKTTAS